MTRVKCRQCGLVNFAGITACRRCGTQLGASAEPAPPLAEPSPPAGGAADVAPPGAISTAPTPFVVAAGGTIQSAGSGTNAASKGLADAYREMVIEERTTAVRNSRVRIAGWAAMVLMFAALVGWSGVGTTVWSALVGPSARTGRGPAPVVHDNSPFEVELRRKALTATASTDAKVEIGFPFLGRWEGRDVWVVRVDVVDPPRLDREARTSSFYYYVAYDEIVGSSQ